MNSMILSFRENGMMVIRRLTSATGRHTLRIPICPVCGDACTVCSGYKTDPPHTFCCLVAAGKPE